MTPPSKHQKFQFRNMGLRISYVIYTLLSFLLATLICSFVINTSEGFKEELYDKYYAQATEYYVPSGGKYDVSYQGQDNGILYYRIFDADDVLVSSFVVDFDQYYPVYSFNEQPVEDVTSDGSGALYSGVTRITIMPIYSDADRALDIALSAIALLAIPLCYGGATIFCAMVFFRRKLKRPIEILTTASEKIAVNELDFSISYDRQDEMGQLCSSFETMRAALMKNNVDTWHQFEERKRLNAAFSHDLRTPLTVLKGHTGMLLSGIPSDSISKEELLEELQVMSGSITRLENYVDAMARLQRLEDVEIHRERVDGKNFSLSLQDTAEIICSKQQIRWSYQSDQPFLFIDPEIVMQVYENILSNSSRYAKSEIEITVSAGEQSLLILVADDGKGFSKRAIEQATNPFYKANENSNDGHLGLGLHICKILCERHGGDISISNNVNGGGLICASFGMKK
jgi:signal transduction histidine kinase